MIAENKILIQAVREGNLDEVNRLLEKNTFGEIDNSGNTILHIGARSARPGVFDLILEKALAQGVDLSNKNKWGSTPLDMAISLENNVVIKAFESRGIVTGIISKEENKLPQELINAIREGNLKKIEELLEAGADVKAVDNSGNNCVHYASSNENIEVFKLISDKVGKEYLTATNKTGNTPLDIAIYNENKEVEKAFGKKGIVVRVGGGMRASRSTVTEDNRDTNIALSDLNTDLNDSEETSIKQLASGLLHAASHPFCDSNATAVDKKLEDIRKDPTVLRNKGMLAKILNARNAKGYTAIHLACLNGSPVSAKALIEEGANIEAEDKEGRTPIHFAAFSDNSDLAEVLLSGDNKLGVKAKPNVKDTVEEFGSLQIATQPENEKKFKYGVTAKNSDQTQDNKTLKFAEILLKYGVDVDGLDKDGCTPLMQAISSNLPGVAKLLIKWGADTNIQTSENYKDAKWTSLHVGANASRWKDNSECIQILLNEGGADVSIKNKKGQTAISLAGEAGRKNVIDLLKHAKFDTIFHTAARESNIEVLDKADSKNVNSFNAMGDAPIHSACGFKENEKAQLFLKALIAKKGDVSLVAGDGYNPLQISAEIGSTGYIKLLLENKANVNSTNEKDGNTALHYATMKGQSGAVEALLKGEANDTIRNHKGQSVFDIAQNNKDKTIIELLNSRRPSTSASSSHPATTFSSSLGADIT